MLALVLGNIHALHAIAHMCETRLHRPFAAHSAAHRCHSPSTRNFLTLLIKLVFTVFRTAELPFVYSFKWQVWQKIVCRDFSPFARDCRTQHSPPGFKLRDRSLVLQYPLQYPPPVSPSSILLHYPPSAIPPPRSPSSIPPPLPPTSPPLGNTVTGPNISYNIGM